MRSDLAFLVLRILCGVPLFALHGWSKAADYAQMAEGFPNPLGLGSGVTLAVAAVIELVGSVFVILGLLTRAAALAIALQLGIAFFLVHGAALSGPQSGELALLYAGMATVVVIGGPGHLSVDRWLADRRRGARAAA